MLGRRSIVALHYRHPSMDGSYEVGNDFRRDLDQVAAMVGLHTSVSVHVDADRRPVRVVCGDHRRQGRRRRPGRRPPIWLRVPGRPAGRPPAWSPATLAPAM